MISQAMPGRALGVLLGTVSLGLLLFTAGCNTIRGMGEDVEAAGSAVSGTAESTEEEMEEEIDEAQ